MHKLIDCRSGTCCLSLKAFPLLIIEYSGTLEDEKQVSKIESPSATTKTRRRRSSWEPLDKSNKRYETLLLERERQPVKDFIMKNIVSLENSYKIIS